MNKAEFLLTLEAERSKLAELCDAIGINRMDTPGVSGYYSTKDIIAHLTAYEAGLVTWLREAKAGRAYVDEVLDHPDLDFRNAKIYEEYKQRSAAEVLDAFDKTWAELQACVEALTDEELTDPEASAWFVVPRWGRKQELWKCIANDGYEHHHQHLPDLERWLGENEATD